MPADSAFLEGASAAMRGCPRGARRAGGDGPRGGNKGRQEFASRSGGAGKPLACPFVSRDGGRSRREIFNPTQLSPPGAGERLPWISADWRAPAAPLLGELSGVKDEVEDAQGCGG